LKFGEALCTVCVTGLTIREQKRVGRVWHGFSQAHQPVIRIAHQMLAEIS
jgi:hypothetical protein